LPQNNFLRLLKQLLFFFKQTNFFDHLDPAILRPGRIDRKIQYRLATKQQAIALFCRFYPESHTTLKSKEKENLSPPEKTSAIQTLAEEFAEGVPEHEFSTAELQGYLLTCKKEPEQAVEGISDWVVQERKERADREVREAERKAKNLEARDMRDANQLQGSLARLGMVTPLTGGGATAVGQQPLGSVREPTAMTTTTRSPNLNGLEDVAGAAPLPSVLAVDNVDASPSRHKPKVNGTTNGRPMTPPRTFSSLG
jgi:chaperone BCS1